ncbi:hypothetical protein [Micromonospora chersina]|uniref:hypothetical protein n=1 Tax=Micromonospora chersina TaxID=47854 RepID=UPI003D8B1207
MSTIGPSASEARRTRPRCRSLGVKGSWVLAAALCRAGHRVHTLTTDGDHGELQFTRGDIIEFVRQFLDRIG